MIEPEVVPVTPRLLGRVQLSVGRGFAACADLLMPPCCVICRTPLTEHHSLCAPCWREVRFIREPLCDVLGVPLPFASGERTVSAAALAKPPAYRRARAVAHYSGIMRDLIYQLKYADRHDARALFGRWLTEAAGELTREADIVVPVPLTRLRLLSRRFNQAAILARELSRRIGVPIDPHVLRRVRRTRSQVGLTHDQRRSNVARAFAVSKRRADRVRGRRVLLVDDVITTGATADACARALLKAGAEHVDVVALGLVTDDVLMAP